MKKLLFGIFVTLAFFSCPKPLPTATTDVQESLNGLSILAADTLIANFEATKDTSPGNTQIWISKQVIDSIFTLFKADSIYGKTPPDGIRIYYSRTSPTAGIPLHSNTNVVLVSTYYAGSRVDSGKQIIQIHSDYYTHVANAGLFKLSPTVLSGTAYHDTNDVNGALLYDTCHCDVPLDTTSKHSILRSTAEQLVQNFHGQPYNAYSEWFDIGMFLYLKQKLDVAGDGIRIYFSRSVNANKFVITTTQNINKAGSPAVYLDRLSGADSIKTHTSHIQMLLLKAPGTTPGGSQSPQPTTSPAGGGTPPPPPQETGEDCPNHC